MLDLLPEHPRPLFSQRRRGLMFTELNDAERAQIALEVSKRYGVMCRPEVIKRVEQGHTTTPEYVWDGRSQLVPVVPKEAGQPLRNALNAKWSALARRNRLEDAKRREKGHAEPQQPQSRAPKQPNNTAAVARVREIAEARAVEIRAFAATGATLREIAAKMEIGEHYARKYCEKWQIEPAPQPRKQNEDVIERRDRIREMAKAGMRAKQIAAALGASERNIWNDLRVLGINLKRAPAPKPEKVKDTSRQDAVIARRARIAECLANGITETRAIAEALQVTMRCVQLDLHAIRLPIVQVEPQRVSRGDIAAAKAERTEEIRRLRELGKTCPEIAHAVGVSLPTIAYTLSKLGLTDKSHLTGHVGNPATVRRVMGLHAKGLTIRRIAAEVGVSNGTVQRIIKANAEGNRHAA